MTRELTGRHVLLIALAAFGTIITANMVLLFAATGSFPGLVVRNAYVASQGWDVRADQQRALGWTATIIFENGNLVLKLDDADGRVVTGISPVITVGRPTTDRTDRVLPFTFDGQAYVSPATLEPGRWRVEVTVDDPQPFTAVTEILIQQRP